MVFCGRLHSWRVVTVERKRLRDWQYGASLWLTDCHRLAS